MVLRQGMAEKNGAKIGVEVDRIGKSIGGIDLSKIKGGIMSAALALTFHEVLHEIDAPPFSPHLCSLPSSA